MKISVLLSIHNGEKLLLKCLESIDAQSYKNMDVIIVDDCSTDTSLDIVNEWKKHSSLKITIIKNRKNLGLTKSLNRGLKKCSGAYVARLDADDWWEEKKVEKQVNFLKVHPDYGYIGTFYVNHFELGGKAKKVSLASSDDDIRKYKFKRNPFAHSCVMIKRDVLKKVQGYDESVRYGQDYNLFMRCLPHTKFHNIPEYLCHRSILKKSISIEKQKEQAKQSIQTRRTFMKDYGSSFADKLYLLEPYMNAYTPNWLKNIKRCLF